MQNIQIYLNSLFLAKPFLLLMIQCFLVSLAIRIIFYKFKDTKYQNYTLIPILILFGYYFGISTSLKILYLLITLSLFNRKYINNWIVSFFVLIQIYIVLGLLSNPNVALIILAILGLILILTTKNFSQLTDDLSLTKKFIFSLNIVELFILCLCFVMGSMPQNQFDAAHANLYNAKTYININSLSPLPESTSSLFPQNAIIYYTFFYQIGQEKSLQLAYTLPFIIIIYCFYLLNINRIFVATILLTPIIIFEATNGYYDLLITSLIFSAATILISKKKYLSNIVMSAFLIGFATSCKYFPIFLTCLPILYIYLFQKKRIFIKIILTILIASFPLTIWLVRSYSFTHNPVFPFLQNIFPTPNFWEKNDVLENNPMIQTTINRNQWVKGAFIYYPVVTYLNTTNFLEALPQYTTIVYIILLPLNLFITLNISKKIITRKSINSNEIILICLFIGYFISGLISRYYRYLWPYQFTIASFSILYLD